MHSPDNTKPAAVRFESYRACFLSAFSFRRSSKRQKDLGQIPVRPLSVAPQPVGAFWCVLWAHTCFASMVSTRIAAYDSAASEHEMAWFERRKNDNYHLVRCSYRDRARVSRCIHGVLTLPWLGQVEGRPAIWINAASPKVLCPSTRARVPPLVLVHSSIPQRCRRENSLRMRSA